MLMLYVSIVAAGRAQTSISTAGAVFVVPLCCDRPLPDLVWIV